MTRRMTVVGTVAAVALAVLAGTATTAAAQEAKDVKEAPKAKPPQHWMWLMTNLLTDEGYNSAVKLMERSAKIGFTGIAVYDSKFAKAKLYPDYGARLQKFRKACTDAKMQLIVGVAPMGYADELLANDPNLAEGMPVRDAVFAVKDGKLVPDDEGVKLVNGDFADVKDGKVVGWELGDLMKVDDEVKYEGKRSLRLDDGPGAGGRIVQKVNVKPWHYYHVSVAIKMKDYEGKDNRIQPYAFAKDLVLAWQPPQVKTDKGFLPLNVAKTCDWTRIHTTFCSLDNTEINLMIGRWDGKSGKIWYADVQLEPGGFVNIIRRESLPLKVTSAVPPNADVVPTQYVEGKDFSEVRDPKLLNDPRPGYYTIWHDVPAVTIPEGSKLKNGDKVAVSYNFTVSCGKAGQMNCCFSEPKVYDLVKQQIEYMKANGNPDIYFMAHDEIRLLGWDDSCARRNMTCGQLLADNAKKCTEIIEKVDPGKPIFVWSDMFDEFHNARKTNDDGTPFIMYLDKGAGPFFGSWEGLGKQVGLVNWNGGSERSYKNFSKLGHQQIISCSSPAKITEWLKMAGKLDGVAGVMYTTWTGDYGPNVEKFIEDVKAWEKDSGGFKE
ncbi:MAG: hypothetical protein ACE15C_03090 [Phycisphaerae bacterium]